MKWIRKKVDMVIGVLSGLFGGMIAGAASEHYDLPTPRYTDFIPTPETVEQQAFNMFREHIIEREGYRNEVYLDSLGKPTVGIGHLVLPRDNLKVGDVISDTRVEQLFQADSKKAFNAALSQAKELGQVTPLMIAGLASVNFQLGTGWTGKFPNTWKKLKTGTPVNVASAIRGLRSSLWAKQTPKRVNDFINVIEETYFA